MQTSRDSLVVAFDEDALAERVKLFVDRNTSDAEARREFFGEKSVGDYLAGDTREWKLSTVRLQLRADTDWRKSICRYLYRPFDERFLLYLDYMVDWPREKTMRHFRNTNYGLCVGRAGLVASGSWDLAFCTKRICDHNLFYRGSSLNFPLYLYEDENRAQGSLDPRFGRRPNLKPAFLDAFCKKLGLDFVTDRRGDLKKTVGPEDMLGYIYALLYSEIYRTRYAESLATDFPRLPLTDDKELFVALVEKGWGLVELHSMESRLLASLTTYDVVGTNEVEKIRYEPETRRVYINVAQFFGGVPNQVWAFRVGGYQVGEKWLKDRRGKGLNYAEIQAYQKIVVAVSETIRSMQQVDAVVKSMPIT